MRILILWLACLLMTGCGFHLRGNMPGGAVDLSDVRVHDAGAPTVGTAIRDQLLAAGQPVLGSEGPANLTVTLTSQYFRQEVLSVSPVTGKVEEYQLTLTLLLTVQDRDLNTLIDNQPVRVTRDYAFDDQAVLGSESERRLLENDMARQAALQIIRQLEALSGQRTS